MITEILELTVIPGLLKIEHDYEKGNLWDCTEQDFYKAFTLNLTIVKH